MSLLHRTPSPSAQLRVFLSIALLATFLALSATSAAAATTFGSSLANAPNDGACGGPSGSTCGTAISGIGVSGRASGGVNAPVSGVVVRWRIRALPGSVTSLSVALRLYRGNAAVGTSAFESSSLSGEIETFSARLPVQAGDRLGLNQTQFGFMMISFASVSYSDTGAGSHDYWGAPPTDGSSATPDSSVSDREILINADVEPDADGDGFGDESQDLCPTDRALQTACPDTTKPVVTALKLTAKRGFSFNSTEAGQYSLHVDRVHAGRLRGGSCARTAKRGPQCKIYRKVKRKSDATGLGANTILLSTKRFPPGRYSVRVIVTDAAGNASEPVDREFTIRRKRR